eukprot:SAG31_NODE_44869_length_261_cov_0.629630_1_plen_71_part_01
MLDFDRYHLRPGTIGRYRVVHVGRGQRYEKGSDRVDAGRAHQSVYVQAAGLREWEYRGVTCEPGQQSRLCS